MKRTFLSTLCALALLSAFLALPAQAQTVVGGTGGATLVMEHGNLHSVGAVLTEVEFQYADDNGVQRGGILAYTGLDQGGGEQVGGGYRYYWPRPGGSFLFVGIGGFVLGNDTPGVSELSGFMGGEVGIQVPFQGEAENKVTAFAGVYPAVAGAKDTAIIRLGARVALN